MNFRRLILFTILSGGLFLQSCNKWLDIQPKLEISREELYSSEQGFKDALTGCYAKLKEKELFGSTLTMTSMELMAQHWEAGGTDMEFRRLNYKNEAVKATFKTVYNNLYTVIAQANDMLAYLDMRGREVIPTEESFKLLKGEALAIRAFCHFELLRIFGQVPKNATIEVSLPYAEIASENRVPAYDYDTYVDKLIRDFTTAEKLLVESDPLTRYTFDELNDPAKLRLAGHDDFGDGFRRIRLNVWAVKALMARMFFYIDDKNNAYDYASEVINAKVGGVSPIVITNAKTDVQNENYTLPSETLFALHVYDLENQTKGMFDGINAYSAVREKTLLTADIFKGETPDIRYGLFVEQLGASGTATVKKVVTKKYWQNDNGLGLNGNLSVSAADNFITMQLIPIIRLGEIYLIAAESAPSMGESDRLMIEFKTHRNITHKNYSTVVERSNDILNQYHRDFWAEGQMFYAYKRLGAKMMTWGFRAVLEEDYIVPLPDGEF